MTTAEDLTARVAALAETSYLDTPLEYGRVMDDPRHLAGQVVTCTLCTAIVMDVDDDDTMDMHARAITSHVLACPPMQKLLGPRLTKTERLFTITEIEDALGKATRASTAEQVRLCRAAGNVHSRLGPALMETIDAGYTLTEIAATYGLPVTNLAALLRDHITSTRDGIPASINERVPELRN